MTGNIPRGKLPGNTGDQGQWCMSKDMYIDIMSCFILEYI